jgi:hypothetical protein
MNKTISVTNLKRSGYFCLIFVIYIIVFSNSNLFSESVGNIHEQECKSPLIRIMLFKLSAHIQDIYFHNKVQGNLSPAEQLYKDLTGIAALQSFDNKHLKQKYPSPLGEIVKNSKSFMEVKNKLPALGIKNIYKEKIPGTPDKSTALKKKDSPGKLKYRQLILINPFCFLPNDQCIRDKKSSARERIELFYGAIILGDQYLIAKAYQNLLSFIKNKNDKAFFNGLFQLSQLALEKDVKKLPGLEIDAEVLAYYFLLTGDFHTPVQINKTQEQKLNEVMKAFKDIYNKLIIEVNADSIKNKVFLWLGTRRALAAGDYNLANACLKSTFGQDVLNNFGPDNQAYFYATLQLALQMDNNDLYGYVYTGLKHLTCHLEQEEIDELIELTNKIRYQ